MEDGLWGAKDAEADLENRQAGRLLTSHSDTDKVKREDRRLTLTAHPGLYSASAKWLLFTEIYQILSPDSLQHHLAEGEECE